MSYITYKQYDSRWGSKNYNGSSSMAAAGCGPTSCATLGSGINSKITPINTMKYMQKNDYAIRNNGTAWAGIPACLKWLGFEDVHEVSTMDALWKVMAKGYKCVILFRGGSRGGITWTTAGHYVPATAYKEVNGKHYLWMRDPGPRNKTGWYCYETQMRGLIVKVWVGKPPQEKPTKLDKLVDTALKCAWERGTPRSKKGYPEGHAKKNYKKALNAAYPDRSGWRDQTKKGASCDVFVGTVVRASGVDKKFPRGCDDILSYMKTDHAKKKWKTLKTRKRKKIPNGAVIYQKYTSGAQHILIKIDDKNIANAHYCSKTYPVIEGYKSKVRSKEGCRVFKVYVPK